MIKKQIFQNVDAEDRGGYP